MPPNWELAVESNDLPTDHLPRVVAELSGLSDLAPAIERQNAQDAKRTRCIPADLRHTIETAHGCQLRKLARLVNVRKMATR